MGNTCHVCRHPKRTSIEREIRALVPFRLIASREKGLSYKSVERHKKGCMAAALSVALQREGGLPCGDEIAQAREMLGLVTKIAQDGASTNDRGAKALAIRAALGVIPFLRTIAEFRGDMASAGPTVNVQNVVNVQVNYGGLPGPVAIEGHVVRENGNGKEPAD